MIGIVAAAKRDEAATRAPVTSAFAGPSWSSDAQVPQGAVHRSADRTNGLAIAALIVVFFSSVVGVILGHVALSQIKRTGEGGRGLALAAVVIGWVSIGIVVIALLVVVGLTVALSGGS